MALPGEPVEAVEVTRARGLGDHSPIDRALDADAAWLRQALKARERGLARLFCGGSRSLPTADPSAFARSEPGDVDSLTADFLAENEALFELTRALVQRRDG